MPKSNVEFWQTKFDRNAVCDKMEHDVLETAGWHVIEIWEYEVRKRLPDLQNIMKGRPV